MKLIIITPQSNSCFDQVDKVIIPGSKGNFTVLRGHAPLVSTLRKGVIQCNQQEIAVEGGVVAVQKDTVTVFIEQ
ncbi:MAG: F0F1 ATP synthase subunit epsilon [Bacteroidales bacterium]|nr:F0F1 ATP synthase subunit epsilon [Bacteroidales bacterium]MCL2738813.1 F0F1 ATP synthase subunit epsilon [Bacteroidales bacterium]